MSDQVDTLDLTRKPAISDIPVDNEYVLAWNMYWHIFRNGQGWNKVSSEEESLKLFANCLNTIRNPESYLD